MEEQKIVFIDVDKKLNIGEETVIASVIDNLEYRTVFEDDGITGYFYAVTNEMEILDALHIYDVNSISDKNIPSNIKILWSEDYSKSFLSINNYYHAMFDFKNNAGYCRNGFPPATSIWLKIFDRKLTDNLLNGEIQ